MPLYALLPTSRRCYRRCPPERARPAAGRGMPPAGPALARRRAAARPTDAARPPRRLAAPTSCGRARGQGLEIAWVEDPVDAFFLQVQGSGRIRLPDGGLLRLGYAGRERAALHARSGARWWRAARSRRTQLSAAAIRAWAARAPRRGRRASSALNESFVFFREVSEVPPDRGPLGRDGPLGDAAAVARGRSRLRAARRARSGSSADGRGAGAG